MLNTLGAIIAWIGMNWVALVVVLLAFGFIIFVHELGHFMCAKRVGITVHEFALGFGPKLLSHKRDETEYCLRAFPFGGFVRMEGEDDPDADANDPGSFQNKTVMQQIVVLGGGCFMNYMSALVVLIMIGFCRGIPAIEAPNEVGVVQDGKPAAVAGVQVGDVIKQINGVAVNNFSDLTEKIVPRAGQPTTLTLQRGDRTLTVTVTPMAADDALTHKKVGRIGIQPSNRITLSWTQPSGAGEVFGMAGYWISKITLLPFEIVRRLTAHEMTVKEVKEGTGGPLAIGQMLFELYHQGIWALLFFWGIISVSVGSFNLLPVPALDGARILFVGLGALRGRPLDPRKEGMVHMVGLMALLAVMVLFTIGDVHRMLSGVHFF